MVIQKATKAWEMAMDTTGLLDSLQEILCYSKANIREDNPNLHTAIDNGLACIKAWRERWHQECAYPFGHAD